MTQFFTQPQVDKVHELRQGYRGEGKEYGMNKVLSQHDFFNRVNASRDVRLSALTSVIVRYKVTATNEETGEVNDLLTQTLNSLESANQYAGTIRALPTRYITKIEEIEL